MRYLPVALVVAASIVGFTQFASAADLPVKAPVAVTTGYNWSGFYVGVNGGYSVARDSSALHSTIVPGGAPNLFPTWKESPAGWVGGAQAGYNWQSNNMVYGVEVDIQASGEKDSSCMVCTSTGTRFIDQKLPWFGTVRGRLGYAADSILIYATGGLAYGSIETDTILSSAGNPTTSGSAHVTKTGWTAGGGIEGAIAGNWTAKIEYLYLDFGSTTIAPFLSGTGGTLNDYTGNVRDHVIRVGLNYRLGASPWGTGSAHMPVKAITARQATNWSGFYAGANVGYGVGRNPATLATNSTAGVIGNDTWNLSPAGWLGGVQGGYNWQVANWVFGVEADIQGSDLTDSVCVQICRFEGGSTNANAIDQKMNWFGTVRGRLGFAAGSALFYTTAGLAYADVETSSTESIGPFTQQVANVKEKKTGWTAGAGIEGKFAANWSAKAEYLYVDLGNTSFSATNVYPGITTFHTFSNDNRSHIFRFGINYHFNSLVAASY